MVKKCEQTCVVYQYVHENKPVPLEKVMHHAKMLRNTIQRYKQL